MDEQFLQKDNVIMLSIKTNYKCGLSKVALNHIIQSVGSNVFYDFELSNVHIAFIDGDSLQLYDEINSVYHLKKNGEIVYVVTLISKDNECFSIFRHLSDVILDKKSSYEHITRKVQEMLKYPAIIPADSNFDESWEKFFKASKKEREILMLLLCGYTPHQIADKLNISIKTISNYKIKAIKRYGARNFNELYISKLHDRFRDYLNH